MGLTKGQHPFSVKPQLATETNTSANNFGQRSNASQQYRTDDSPNNPGQANLNAGSMIDGSQTQQEVATLTAELLKPKHKIQIGCWNVRTMYQTGKLAQIVKECENYNIDILGISEARWTGVTSES